MRQTLRKIVAVLALVGLSMNLVPSALAATTVYTDVSAANKLASLGIIVDKSANTADYRLGDTVLRQEAVKVVAGALGGILENEASYTCTGAFSDIANGTWVCRIAELAKNAGLVAANPTFRPTAKLSKLEAIIFALRSAELMPAGSHSTDAILGFAVDAQLISSAAGFSVNAPATRGEFFRYVARALDSAELPDICTIAPDLCGGNNGGGSNTSGAVSVSLASGSPAGYTVPLNANGLHVASYRVTAAAATTLTSVKLKRVGLSADADVTDFTVLVNGARVTDPKDENSDDEVTLTLKNGGVRLSANQSVTLDVLLNVAASGTATVGAEFAVSLVEVLAGGTVSGLPVTGSTFKVGSTSASAIVVNTDGSVTDPKLGQTGADLFRFKVENNSSNDTISLHAITFEQIGSADTAADLRNFVLKRGSTVLATTAMSDGDYVTFKLATPLSLTQGNNASLRVSADIVGGAGETIEFQVDNKLDVDASSSRFGSAIAVTLTGATYAAVDIDAGAISLVKMDATATKIREDKEDVVLGTLDIIAGQAGLEIKKIAFAIAANTGNVGTYLEDVQLRNVATGARYDLSASTDGASREYSDASFDFTLVAGSNKFEVIADTLTTISSFDAVNLTLSMVADQTLTGTNGYLVIEETSDDEVVTDVTPSSLTWKKVEGSESGATVSVLTLSDLTRVRGANDVVAMQLEIKADESSALTVDEIKALVQTNTDGVTGTATSQMVSQVALYKGSTVSSAALLDAVSGSQLASGVATFEGFVGGDVVIPANGSQVFTVTVSFVDGTDASNAANSPYRVQVAGSNISAQDDENDDVTISGTYTSARDITVTDTGSVTLTADANNDDNKDAKTLLAGTTAKVFSIDTQATNEAVDVEKVTFSYVTARGNLKDAAATAELHLGDTMIDTAPNADITTGTQEVSTITVTAAASSSANATVTLNGVATTVALTNGDSTTAVATKIAAAVNTTSTHTATSSGAVVTITANGVGDQTNTAYTVGTTGATATAAVVTPGVAGTVVFGGSSAGAMTTLIVPMESRELKLAIVSKSMGFEKEGALVSGLDITGVATEDATGVSSGRDVTDVTASGVAASSSLASFVPATVTPTVVTALSSSSSQAKIRLQAAFGGNVNTNTPGGTPTVSLDSLTFSMPGVVGVVATDFVLYEEGNSAVQVTGSASGSNVVFDLTSFANSDFSGNKTFVIVPTIDPGETATLTLLENGVQYDVDGVTNATNIQSTLTNELDFGSRSIAN